MTAVAKIQELLGGEAVTGPMRTDLDLVRLVRRGVPTGAVDHFLRASHLTFNAIEGHVMARRTFKRRPGRRPVAGPQRVRPTGAVGPDSCRRGGYIRRRSEGTDLARSREPRIGWPDAPFSGRHRSWRPKRRDPLGTNWSRHRRLIVHRLAKAAFTRLDGEGARLFGGRWNSAGRPAIYAAASPSLAVLEVLVHLDLPAELMPDDYHLLALEVPDDAPVERLHETPVDADACVAVGDRFLALGAALTLLVPSVVVPQEHNAIVNVRHPAMGGVRVISDQPFHFDPRLLAPTAR